MPQIYFEKLKSFGNAEFFFWNIKENCNELSELIADHGVLLAESIRRFKSTIRQKEWLAVRVLLQQTPYKNINIIYNGNGKPYLADSSKYISISHTREYVAIAVSDQPIGVDVEIISRNAFAVAESFLKPREMECLYKEDNPTEEALFLWCVKEAAFKLASEKVSVLKEIGITKNANDYLVTYPDATVAKCSVCKLDDLILSFCR